MQNPFEVTLLDMIFNTTPSALPTISTPSNTPVHSSAERIQPKLPDLYIVLLHNDDSTDPSFVVEVLCQIFAMNKPRAYDVMGEAHNKGIALVGAYSRDIAETKVNQAMLKAASGRNARFPGRPCELTFSTQPE